MFTSSSVEAGPGVGSVCDAGLNWAVMDSVGGMIRLTVDAAVVLAGDPGYERTWAGVELVRAGRARLLVLTGGEPGPGDSAESLRAKALEWGVPPEKIRFESVSRSTRESLLAVAPILRGEGVASVALVTSPYHQRRAFLLARQVWPGVRVLSRPAVPSFWSPDGWWRQPASRRVVFREYAKIVYSAVRGWF